MEKNHYVLDSFALLCFFEDEPGADEVQMLLEAKRNNECELFMDVVNLSEIYYIIKRRSGQEKASQALSLINTFSLNLENVDKSLSVQAGDIKSDTTMALADCFCVATAKKYFATVITGDPEFEKVENDVQIKWLPKK